MQSGSNVAHAMRMLRIFEKNFEEYMCRSHHFERFQRGNYQHNLIPKQTSQKSNRYTLMTHCMRYRSCPKYNRLKIFILQSKELKTYRYIFHCSHRFLMDTMKRMFFQEPEDLQNMQCMLPSCCKLCKNYQG